VSLLFSALLHCYHLVLIPLTNALIFVDCPEAFCNGETPWEEDKTHARGEEEERAGRVLDWDRWTWSSCTKAQERRGAGTGDTCTRFILLLFLILNGLC
jgi:hypothetical protein